MIGARNIHLAALLAGENCNWPHRRQKVAEAADLRPPTGTAVIARHVWRYPPLAAGHHYPAGIDDGTGGQEGSPNKKCHLFCLGRLCSVAGVSGRRASCFASAVRYLFAEMPILISAGW